MLSELVIFAHFFPFHWFMRMYLLLIGPGSIHGSSSVDMIVDCIHITFPADCGIRHDKVG